MIEELRARFMPRFIETARDRLSRASDGIDTSEGPGCVQAELHALAGEASLLGLAEIAETARRGESAARSWAVDPSPKASTSCAEVLRSLARDIDALSGDQP